jgi:CRP-like cAMP-binding protein
MARGRDSAYLEILGGIPLFDGLTKKQLRFIARMVSEVPLRAGSTFVKQGEPGQEAMVVEEGSGVVIRDGEEIAEIGPGDVVGEMSLIVHQPRNATVRAISDMKILVMDSREFSSILGEYPEVAVRILETVVRRLIKAQDGATL